MLESAYLRLLRRSNDGRGRGHWHNAGGSISRTHCKISAGPQLRSEIGVSHNFGQRCGTGHSPLGRSAKGGPFLSPSPLRRSLSAARAQGRSGGHFHSPPHAERGYIDHTGVGGHRSAAQCALVAAGVALGRLLWQLRPYATEYV